MLPATARALELIRKRLVAAKRVEDRPILIELPYWSGFVDQQRHIPGIAAQLAAQTDCHPDNGDSDEGTDPQLGDCYRIATTPSGYPELRGLVMALRDLSGETTDKTIDDLKATTRAARGVSGISFRLDTVHSPDGRYAVSRRWRDGKSHLELRRGGKLIRILEIKGELAHRPVWSGDGQRVAFATLSEATLLSVSTRKRIDHSFDPLAIPMGKVALAFDADGQQLAISYGDITSGQLHTLVWDQAEPVYLPDAGSLFYVRPAAMSNVASALAAEAAAEEALEGL